MNEQMKMTIFYYFSNQCTMIVLVAFFSLLLLVVVVEGTVCFSLRFTTKVVQFCIHHNIYVLTAESRAVYSIS